jgi:hypothetical protein
MLIMSDFQLVAGLAILTSGFSQLRCGISAYHWQHVVRLAWFSSVTHLCCLTFLREQFYQRKVVVWWRVSGMVILILMLIIAMIPTANYTWAFIPFEDLSVILEDGSSHRFVKPDPRDHAICFFTLAAGVENIYNAQRYITYQRVIISAVLLGFGMIKRIWPLFRLPDEVYHHVRKRMSAAFTGVLHKVFGWTSTWTVSSHLILICVYRPLLAIFLSFRILLDIVTSRFFDVLWLLISFCWGTLSLWLQRPLHSLGGQQWTFGQVIALVLLIAPAIALFEGFASKAARGPRDHVNSGVRNEGSQNSRSDIRSANSASSLPVPVSSAAALAEPPIAPNQLGPAAIDHPERDFYRFSDSFSVLVYVTISIAVTACGISLFGLVSTPKLAPLELANPSLSASIGISSAPVLVGFLSFCVLLSFVLEVPSATLKAPYSLLMKPLYLFIYIILLGLASAPSITWTVVSLTCLAMYLVLSSLVIYWRWRQRKNHGS